jgi:hypothetical protein
VQHLKEEAFYWAHFQHKNIQSIIAFLPPEIPLQMDDEQEIFPTKLSVIYPSVEMQFGTLAGLQMLNIPSVTLATIVRPNTINDSLVWLNNYSSLYK